MTSTIDAEQFRMVPFISSHTLALSASVLLASFVVSALFVRRKLDRLDLVAVLKQE
jgi:hypothetical protein